MKAKNSLIFVPPQNSWTGNRLGETRKNIDLTLKKIGDRTQINYSMVRGSTKKSGDVTDGKMYIPGFIRNESAGKLDYLEKDSSFLLGEYSFQTNHENKLFVVSKAKTIRQCKPEKISDREGNFKTTLGVFQDYFGGVNSQETRKKVSGLAGSLKDIDLLLLNKLCFDAVKAGCKTIYFKSKNDCPLIGEENQESLQILKNKGFITHDEYIGDGYVARLNTSLILGYLEKMQDRSPTQNPSFSEENKKYNIGGSTNGKQLKKAA